MALREDLQKEVTATFTGGKWDEEKALVVPGPEGLRLNSNHAKKLDSATVLYADIDSSTNMVDRFAWWFAAEVYKAYLRCASQIIKHEGGVITAYDGDRVMAIFKGDAPNTTAVRSALQINWVIEEIVRPTIKAKYPTTNFTFNHVIGIDTSALHVARIGVHGDNDLVWVGRAANHAAKLCTLSERPLWITETVYNAMQDSVKLSNGVNMWEKRTWTAMGGKAIYRSAYRWWTLG